MSAWRLCRWRVARGSRLATQAIPKDDNLLISYFVRLSLSFMHTHSTHCVLAYLTHFYWQRHTHRRGKAAGKKDETKKRKEGRAKSFPKLDPNVNRRLLGFMTSRFIGNEEWQPVFFSSFRWCISYISFHRSFFSSPAASIPLMLLLFFGFNEISRRRWETFSPHSFSMRSLSGERFRMKLTCKSIVDLERWRVAAANFFFFLLLSIPCWMRRRWGRVEVFGGRWTGVLGL